MNKIAIVYWSGTGNTEMMAQEIAAGAREAGAGATLCTASEFSAERVPDFDRLAFGCPSMGAEELEDSEFEPMFTAAEDALRDKEILLFGSYGWGDGQWMRDWQQRCEDAGIKVFEGQGLILQETPDTEGLDRCHALGKAFAES